MTRILTAWCLCLPLALAAADYPGWRGDGTGSVGEAGVPLVDSWDQARIAWVSEAKHPHPWNFSVVRGMTYWPRTVLGNGGYCQPALVGGRLYVMFWRGSGEITATTGPGKYDRRWAKSGIPALSLIDADAVIVCVDAATGRTLWETVYPGTEMNHVELYGGHNNLRVAGGRVFAIGGTGLLYAVDAATGAKLWTAELGPSAALWRWYKADCMARRSKEAKPPAAIPEDAAVPPPPPPPDGPRHPLGGSLNNATYNVCPVVVDGAVVTGEWARGGGLVAFDAATGEELWRRRGWSGTCTPLPWGEGGVVLPGARGTTAVAARTGEPLWKTGEAAGPTQVAVAGEIFVAPGKAPKGSRKKLGWGAWRVGPEGPQRLWLLDERHLPSGYLAPVVHRGRAWLPFRRGKAAGKGCAAVGRGRMGLACVDLETGVVLGETCDLPTNSCCPGPLAMGDRLLYQYTRGIVMAALDEERPRSLGVSRQHSNYCSSCAAGDGFVYFRSGERLLVCLDLRHPDSRPAPPARHDDPGDARYAVDLPGLRTDGKDLRLCLRGRDGCFPQAWLETRASGYGYPDVIEAGCLAYADGRLHGRGRAVVEGRPYDLAFDLAVGDNGSVAGTCRDVYEGVPVKGAVAGGIAARPAGDATLTMFLPRHFFGGQNQGQEPVLTVIVADGVVTAVEMESRLGVDSFVATVRDHDLAWAAPCLTGGIDFAIDSKSEIVGGDYRLVFDAEVRHNLVYGGFTSTRAGAATTRHRIFTYPPFSTGVAPADTPVGLDDAVIAVDLPKAVSSTMGLYDLHLVITHRDGESSGIATTATVGIWPVDCSELRIADGTVAGTVAVAVGADGYALRAATDNRYRLDLELEGTRLGGTYAGLAGRREPRAVEASGTWYNED